MSPWAAANMVQDPGMTQAMADSSECPSLQESDGDEGQRERSAPVVRAGSECSIPPPNRRVMAKAKGSSFSFIISKVDPFVKTTKRPEY